MTRLLHALLHRLRALARRNRVESELDEELRFHLEMEVERLCQAGSTREEARRQARLAFGAVERVREECRDERGVRLMDDLAADLRHGVRVLRRAPVFTVVAVLTLALGIGSGTAVFSLVDGVLLRPLVYPDAERLFWIFEGNRAGEQRPPAYPRFEAWRGALRGVDIAYVRGEEFPVRGDRGIQRLMGAFVSERFFAVVGTPPLLGRTFAGGRGSSERGVVISHALWVRRFSADPAVVGRQLATPSGPYTIIGVMPRGYRAPFFADLWLPLGALPPTSAFVLSDPDLHADSWTIGRLRRGSTRERAAAEIAALGRSAPREAGARPWDAPGLIDVRSDLVGPAVVSRLAVLAAAVALMLLVACVNVANLTLARATFRTREIALRAALGARRGRLVRQLMAEGLLLAAAGGALGTAMAWLSVRWLRSALPEVLPRMGEVAVDGRVLAAAAALTLATTVIFALVPAWRAASVDLTGPLRSVAAGGPGAVRLRTALVVGQIALALILAVGAGLLARSLRGLTNTEPGFQPGGLVVVRLFPPADRTDEESETVELYRRLREAAAAIPGVRAAAIANHLPLAGGAAITRAAAPGRASAENGTPVLFRTVSPEYFPAMGTRLVRGRLLGEQDRGSGGGVVVNRAMAEALWGAKDPVGSPLVLHHAAQGRAHLGDEMAAIVVGVVEDERFLGLDQPPAPAAFVPYQRDPWPNTWLVVRHDGDPGPVIDALRGAILRVDPDLPVDGPAFQAEVRPFSQYLSRSLQSERLTARMLGGLGLAGFALAMIGVGGVMAYLVGRRGAEIGVRLALGAHRRDVGLLVAGQALRMGAAGVGIGLCGALAATRLLRSQLSGVSPFDPTTYSLIAAAFLCAVLLAALGPAWRAVRISPISALRAE